MDTLEKRYNSELENIFEIVIYDLCKFIIQRDRICLTVMEKRENCILSCDSKRCPL